MNQKTFFLVLPALLVGGGIHEPYENAPMVDVH